MQNCNSNINKSNTKNEYKNLMLKIGEKKLNYSFTKN